MFSEIPLTPLVSWVLTVFSFYSFSFKDEGVSLTATPGSSLDGCHDSTAAKQVSSSVV